MKQKTEKIERRGRPPTKGLTYIDVKTFGGMLVKANTKQLEHMIRCVETQQLLRNMAVRSGGI